MNSKGNLEPFVEVETITLVAKMPEECLQPLNQSTQEQRKSMVIPVSSGIRKAPVLGKDFGQEICDALGVKRPLMPFDMAIHIPADGVVTIEIKTYVDSDGTQEIKDTLQDGQYTLMRVTDEDSTTEPTGNRAVE